MRRLLSGWLVAFALLALHSGAESISQGPFTVDFDPVDRGAAEDGLHYLLEARDEFAPRLPLGDAPVTMRIARDLNEFLGLSGMYGHVAVNGVTRADHNAIAVKSPRFRSIEEDYRGTVRHELVHILLHRNTDAARLPRWLNEGICMLLANEIQWQSAIQVTRMHLTGQIIPLESLDQAFAARGTDQQFSDAYAQALSMTRKLYDELGEEKFWAVVRAVRTVSFGEAMAHTGGLPVAVFWQDYSRGLWLLTVITTLRTGSFWGIVAVLSLLAFAARWIRNRQIVRRWDDDADPAEPDVFDWDRILEDADAWKRGSGP